MKLVIGLPKTGEFKTISKTCGVSITFLIIEVEKGRKPILLYALKAWDGVRYQMMASFSIEKLFKRFEREFDV
jgi:hypothetical protein